MSSPRPRRSCSHVGIGDMCGSRSTRVRASRAACKNAGDAVVLTTMSSMFAGDTVAAADCKSPWDQQVALPRIPFFAPSVYIGG